MMHPHIWKLSHHRTLTVALVVAAIAALAGPFVPAAADSYNSPLYNVHDSNDNYFNY